MIITRQLGRKVVFTLIDSAKHDGDTWSKPVFGRCWFFPFPKIRWNGGTPRDVVTDISVFWLFYSLGFLIWWRN